MSAAIASIKDQASENCAELTAPSISARASSRTWVRSAGEKPDRLMHKQARNGQVADCPLILTVLVVINPKMNCRFKAHRTRLTGSRFHASYCGLGHVFCEIARRDELTAPALRDSRVLPFTFQERGQLCFAGG